MVPELSNFNFSYYDIIKMISIQLKPYYLVFILVPFPGKYYAL